MRLLERLCFDLNLLIDALHFQAPGNGNPLHLFSPPQNSALPRNRQRMLSSPSREIAFREFKKIGPVTKMEFEMYQQINFKEVCRALKMVHARPRLHRAT